jgi:hypothetical protein
MNPIRNIVIVVAVVALVLGLVVVIGLQQPARNGLPASNLTTPLNPSINIDSIYWSLSGEATAVRNICANKSRLGSYEFTILGSSNVSLNRLEGCRVVLNDQGAESELRSIEGQIKISSEALTHFENTAQLCCSQGGQSYCSQETTLTVCELDVNEIELPEGPARACNYVSDCVDQEYCDSILSGFEPHNCGQPFEVCGNRYCECRCQSVNYQI